jgi:hypothetical protein
MSLLVNQTAINPEVNFFASSEQGAYVASVTAGSNVTLTGTATNPVINAIGGSSSDSVSRYGAKTIADSGAVSANNIVTLFTIPNTYFPLSDSSYLLKVNYVITSATTASALTGGLGVQVNYSGASVGNQYIYLNSQSNWTNTSNVPNEAGFCGTFIPSAGSAPLTFVLVNATSGNLTSSAISFDISITGLTTSNVSANNWP